jgi:hypothetical protein
MGISCVGKEESVTSWDRPSGTDDKAAYMALPQFCGK